MPKEVLVALIAVGGVMFTQLITYIISRQSARDLRVNIDREIEIIKKLRSDSAEAQQLERHVKASIQKLIERDERRERLVSALMTAAPVPILTAVSLGVGVWREHTDSPTLQAFLAVVFWGIFGLILGLATWSVWGSIKNIYSFAQYWVPTVRRKQVMRRRVKKSQRRLAKTQRGAQELEEKFAARKDSIIATGGPEEWEAITESLRTAAANRETVATELTELAREIRNIKPAREYRELYRRLIKESEAADSVDR
ncbi:hypothetical protein P3H80_01130 [Mycolicibacterium septicum]|uniref:hypothetical protein n=1 Tax=Mycolicibacterium septicum TaxID=98668 RepID=UPI0023E31AE9|nr:hypothetical protein [Mycolicibacterium septicum]MDF3336001.1 hypothetical protein [Mycolicibacterium septicum]